ncbi:hypothetical protein V8F20_011510 [Naviculisporaceae sp. PSN 640]
MTRIVVRIYPNLFPAYHLKGSPDRGHKFGPEVSRIAIIVIVSLMAAIFVGWQVWLCCRGHRSLMTCFLRPPQKFVTKLKERRRRWKTKGNNHNNEIRDGNGSELPLFQVTRP